MSRDDRLRKLAADLFGDGSDEEEANNVVEEDKVSSPTGSHETQEEVLSQLSYRPDSLPNVSVAPKKQSSSSSIPSSSTPSESSGVKRRPPEEVIRKSQEFAKLGNVRMKDGNFKAALSFWNMAIERYGDIQYYIERSVCNGKVGKFDVALSDAEVAIKLDPRNPDCFHVKGRALIGLNQFKDAETALRVAMDIHPCDEYKDALREVRELALTELDFPRGVVKNFAMTYTSIQEAVDSAVEAVARSAEQGTSYGVAAFKNSISSISRQRSDSQPRNDEGTDQNDRPKSRQSNYGNDDGLKSERPRSRQSNYGNSSQGDFDSGISSSGHKSSNSRPDSRPNSRGASDGHQGRSRTPARNYNGTGTEYAGGSNTVNGNYGGNTNNNNYNGRRTPSRPREADYSDTESVGSCKSNRLTRSKRSHYSTRSARSTTGRSFVQDINELTEENRIRPENLFKFTGLFLGNLDTSVTEEILRDYFEEFGRLEKVQIHPGNMSAFLIYDSVKPTVDAIYKYHARKVEALSGRRKLVFRFVPGHRQYQGKRNQGRDWTSEECYYWRTTGCDTAVRMCDKVHHPMCRGLDFQPWMVQDVRF